jgi:hypothetical protein
MRWLVPTIIVVVAFLGGASWAYIAYFKPRVTFRQLLEGSDHAHISSLVISGQNKKVTLSEPEVAEYLTQAFRSAKRDSYLGGITYYADVHLSTAGSVTCGLYVPAESGVITVSFPLDDTTTYYYLITLPEPIPDLLRKTLDSLR